jgi:hypothetical protein
MVESLLDGLGLRVYVFELNQFPRNSRPVNRLPCEDVPIFLEEFDEHEFLFGIQIVTYVSNLGRLLHGNRIVLLSVSSGWMEVLASCMIRSGGDPTKAFFNSWSSVDAVSQLIVSELSLSQSKARLISPLMEMTPREAGIFTTK